MSNHHEVVLVQIHLVQYHMKDTSAFQEDQVVVDSLNHSYRSDHSLHAVAVVVVEDHDCTGLSELVRTEDNFLAGHLDNLESNLEQINTL